MTSRSTRDGRRSLANSTTRIFRRRGVTRYYEDEVSEPGEYTISLEDNALFVTPTVSLSLTLDCWDMPLVRRNIGIGSFADGVREIRRLLIGESGSANPPGQQSRHPA